VHTLLKNAANNVMGAYAQYHANAANLGGLAPLNSAADLENALRTNYDLMSSTGSMSELRAELMSLSPNGRCPMCGVGESATLDHYLPKSRFSEFSVFATNLVPACDSCNRRKGTGFNVAANRQFLHAYFHHLPAVPLLVAEVEGVGPISIDYGIADVEGVNPDISARLRYQFDKLDLRDRFRRVAGGEISDRRRALENYYGANNDSARVRFYLQREADSVVAQLGLNHWKSALFNALAQSADFCAGGFR
jgi:5-methylcytosine-specific restriction endonuclease McrA